MAKVKKSGTNPHDLEQILRKIIEESGRSQKAIAEESGVAAGQLSRFMRGNRSMTLKTVSGLAKTLGFTLAKL